MAAPMRSALLTDLDRRGLVADATSLEELDGHLASPAVARRSIYVGFDPTADSLHVGSLLPLLALRRFPRVFVKISHTWSLSAQPYPYADTHAQVRRLYDAFGPQRLIAGTDWPLVEKYCTYAQAVELARSRIAFLNDEDRRWICGKTAELVWPG